MVGKVPNEIVNCVVNRGTSIYTEASDIPMKEMREALVLD